MPAGIIQGENAQEVSAFVGAYAGQAGDTTRSRWSTRTIQEEAPRGAPPESCAEPEKTAARVELPRLGTGGGWSARGRKDIDVRACGRMDAALPAGQSPPPPCSLGHA